MNHKLAFDLSTLRRAGAKRARAGRDIAGEILHGAQADGDTIAELARLERFAKGMRPMAGGAQWYVQTALGAVNFAVAPGAALAAGPLVPNVESPLILALCYLNAVTFTAAAEAVTFIYGSTTGTAVTGGTLYSSPTNPTMAATTVPVTALNAVPLAGINTFNWPVGVGGAGATATNCVSFFALLGLN
jgi:hypothetical protein